MRLNRNNTNRYQVFETLECVNRTIELPNVVDRSKLLSRREQVKNLSLLDKQKLIKNIYDSEEKSDVNMGTLYVLQRTLKEKIYRTYKFMDPKRDNFDRPDFTDERGKRGNDLTLVIADKIFKALDMNSCSEEEKASFWKTYSGKIARWFSLNRCANTKAIKRSFESSKCKID